MMSIFKFEFKRFRRIFFIFWCVFIINLVLINKGFEYFDVFETTGVNDFQDLEQTVVKNYSDYIQYSTRGFRILKKPTPLYPLFNLSVKDKSIITIDTSTDLKFNKSVKRKLQSDDPKALDGIWLLTVMILAVYFGHKIFIRPGASLSLAVLTRLLFINIFLLCITLPKFIAVWRWVDSASFEIYYQLSAYSLLIHLIISVFFIMGVALKKVGIKLSYSLSGIATILVILTSIVSSITASKVNELRSEEDLSKKMMYQMLKFQNDVEGKVKKYSANERQALMKMVVDEMQNNYLNNVFPYIKSTEKAFYSHQNELNNGGCNISLISPINYIRVQERYLSEGIWSDFVIYCHKVEYDFLKFYIKKRFVERKRKVDIFINKKGNIYNSISALPPNIKNGFIAYSSALLFMSLMVLLFHKKPFLFRKSRKKQIISQGCLKAEVIEATKNSKGFSFMEISPDIIDDVFLSVQMSFDASYSEKVSKIKFPGNVNIVELMNLTSEEQDTIFKLLSKVKASYIFDKFRKDDLLTVELRKFEEYHLQFVYTAAVIAKSKKYVVIKNTVAMEAEVMRSNFTHMLRHAVILEKKIMYISSVPYTYTIDDLTENIQIEANGVIDFTSLPPNVML